MRNGGSRQVRLVLSGVMIVSALAWGLAWGSALAGCSADREDDASRVLRIPGAEPPEAEGLAVSPRTLPGVGEGGTIVLRGGGQIHTVTIGGRVFVPIEATFSEASWQLLAGHAAHAARAARVRAELERILEKIDARIRVVGAELSPSVGLASALVPLDAWGELARVPDIGYRVLVAPIVSTPMERAERDMARDRALGLGSFADLGGLGGLASLGVAEFLDAVEVDIGQRPDGSHVSIGVVDTGITYAHPAFSDGAGLSRIDSMKDFTGEGRIFFTSAGRFEVGPVTAVPPGALTTEALSLTADYLLSPNSVYESPDPADLRPLEAETILVGPELHALLTAGGASGARFGVLSEAPFKTRSRGVDLDQNGKTDDLFYAILVPGVDGAPDRVWLALSGRGDFRKSVPLTSYGVAKATQPIFSERIGLDIKKETILDASGEPTPVTTAALVGFDPGNHGSHVAGIAAARKLIANAPDDTELRGVAPLARIMSGRICANTGGCRGTKAIVDLAESGAHVINMSIGSLDENNDGYGVQEAIIDRLTMQNDTIFVIAASNDGPGRQTVGSPSVSRLGISVGATASPSIIQNQYSWPGSGKVPSSSPDEHEFLMYFSSRGPTAAGGMKPDVTAPGAWLSAIQLNAAPGAPSGLNVMWGTSMASPAAAGAVALLLDAAKRWNAIHPGSPVATDARTIRRVVLASARPFDVTSLEVASGATRSGQYTFVDQGFGMVSLPRAWELLKSESVSRVVAGVSYVDGAGTHDVPLDWHVRVLRTNPNGLAYDGTRSIEGAGGAAEARLGRGLWIDAAGTDSLFKVQIARRLPANVLARPDIGDLALQLKTTADELELETVVHGSHLPWVRAGNLNMIDCAASPPPAPGAPAPRLLVVGEGAVDVPVNPETGAGGSIAQASSVLHVCVDRDLASALPPGDHGALISAYRVSGGAREAVPAFVVPVTMTVPHKTLAGQSGYHVASTVESFGVARNYVDVPKGTSIVKVTLEVPPPTVAGASITGCAGVSLEALEAGNTWIPPEHVADPSSAIAQSCTSAGKVAASSWRKSTYTRVSPRPGIWDLHVFGLYAFTSSAYTLDVAFAKVASSKPAIEGPPAVLAGAFDVDVLDASYALVLSATQSRFTLAEHSQKTTSQVAHGAKLRVPDNAGVVGRTYGTDVAKVTIATSDSAGNDLDLEVLECDDAALTTCRRAGASARPADVESVSFTPKAGKLYVAEVEGYSIKANNGAFALRESQRTRSPESGALTMTQPSATKFTYATSFDTTLSALFADARYTTGAYTVDGEIEIKDDGGTTILRIPVRVQAP